MLLLVLELAPCSHFRMALGHMTPQLPPQLAHPLLRCRVLNNMMDPLLRSGLEGEYAQKPSSAFAHRPRLLIHQR